MDFIEHIGDNFSDDFIVSNVTSFSYFVAFRKLKIHFVKVKEYNPSNYQNESEKLRKKYGHFITVFEDIFKSNPNKLLNRIQYHLGYSNRIHGRETVLKKITKPEAIEFLKKNHGNIPLKTKYSFALINKSNKIVAVACFGQIIRMRNGSKSSELIRFCNISGARVVGGLTKLINYFKNLHELDELMTYCDLEWSNGDNFIKLGFIKKAISQPHEFVVNLNSWERIPYSIFKEKNLRCNINENEFQTISNLGSIKFIKYFNEN